MRVSALCADMAVGVERREIAGGVVHAQGCSHRLVAPNSTPATTKHVNSGHR